MASLRGPGMASDALSSRLADDVPGEVFFGRCGRLSTKPQIGYFALRHKRSLVGNQVVQGLSPPIKSTEA